MLIQCLWNHKGESFRFLRFGRVLRLMKHRLTFSVVPKFRKSRNCSRYFPRNNVFSIFGRPEKAFPKLFGFKVPEITRNAAVHWNFMSCLVMFGLLV